MSDSTAFVQDEFFDSLLADFLDESGQLLTRLNENLLELDEWAAATQGENACDLDLLNDMFRSAHSIKGLSAMLGLGHVNCLTHRIENVFDAARKDELRIDAAVVEVVFQSVDLLAAMIEQLKEEGTDEVESEAVMEKIQQLLSNSGCARAASTQSEAESALRDLQSAAEATPPESPPQAKASTALPSTPANAEKQQTAMTRPNYFADVVDESEVPAKYLSIFIDETVEAIDTLTEALLNGETEGGSTETLLITSHRIKGSAASVGLHRPAKLAHLMEDILQELRESGESLTADLTDAMLGCTDALRQYVDGLKQGDPESESFNDLAHNLLNARNSDAKSAHSDQAEELSSSIGDEQNAADGEASGGPDFLADARDKVDHEGPAVVGRVSFEADLPLVGLKARLVYEKLLHDGEVLWSEPAGDTLEEQQTLSALAFLLAGEHELEALRNRLSVAGVADVSLAQFLQFNDGLAASDHADAASSAAAPITAVAPPRPELQPASAENATDVETEVEESADAAPSAAGASKPAARRPRGADAASTAKPNETLRVDIERLDQLMNLAGQLVINKARFARIGDGLKGSIPAKHAPHLLANAKTLASKVLAETEQIDGKRVTGFDLDALRSNVRRLQSDLEIVHRELNQLGAIRSRVNDLFEAVHQLDRVTDGIQKSVMDTRMVPIGPLFGRFKRVIRDITRANGKDVRLVIRGEKTELDKRMIDELGDPLIHMVRNSADHGIESPEARAAAGKPQQGEITLDAFHRGNSIYIQVRDDGKGLDRDRILNKAIEKKIITPGDIEKLTPHQIYQLIWEPGFSTAEKVTEISGRGMGMDIVRSKIEELNGSVEVDSEPGNGATFTIKLPLTLAILPSLMAEIDGDVIALPIESVVEIVSVPADELATVHGLTTATIRGRIVSVVDLNEVFTWNKHAAHSRSESRIGAEKTIVVIGQEGCELGLLVHSLLGEEDIVIKSLAENYRNVAGIAGASILGDGRVSLILDINAVIDMSSRAALRAPKQAELSSAGSP